MTKKTKLELTWPGKEERPKLEPRILIEHPDKSYHAATRGEGDLFDNMLIKGDNLLALKALEAEYSGRVKCIYIDPPYNTGSAMEFYEDGLEHSLWLTLLRDRLEILKSLLANDGFIFIQIDDNEIAYLTVLADEIFGRENRINIIAVKMSEATGVKMTHANKRMPKQKEYILFYKKEGSPLIKPPRIAREGWNDEYKELLLNVSEVDLETVKGLLDEPETDNSAVVEANKLLADAQIVSLSNFFRDQAIASADREAWKWQNAWRIVQAVGAGSLKERAIKARTQGAVSAVLSARRKLSIFKTNFDETSRDPRIRFLFADKYLTFNPGDFWTDIKTSGGVGEEGGVYFPKGKKPEALIRRILDMCTSEGDLVLDSFAGSGTTGAVAHKMRRRWIMVEIGDHADTHVIPRLHRVIDADDQSGISNAVDWQGGGGFRYYTLAPSLLERDRWGNWVIASEYNPAMLAEAMCKHLGFTYAPSQDEAEYWRHGQSSETDFLYVTTQSLTHDALRLLSEEVGPKRTLMVCARAFSGNLDTFPSLTCRKIPSTILTKCEWGRNDYSLNVAALPEAEPEQADSAGPLFAVPAEDRTDG